MKLGKKIFAALLAACLLFTLTACGEQIKITLPAGLIQNLGIDTSGVSGKAVQNKDGSLTMTMTEKEHDTLMAEMHTKVETSFENMLAGQDNGFDSIQKIEGNDDMTAVTVTVDREKYESSLDSIAMAGIYMQTMLYQIFDGEDAEDTHTTIFLADASNGEIFQTDEYPDVLTADTEADASSSAANE